MLVFLNVSLFDFTNYGIQIIFILWLLYLSGRISGSEVAFLSFSEKELDNSKYANILHLKSAKFFLANPKKLLAIVLVANNFINILIVLLSTYIINRLFYFEAYPWAGFLAEVVLVSFVILLFGEIIPKIQAYRSPISFALRYVKLLKGIDFLFGGVSNLLIYFSNILENKLTKLKTTNMNFQELSQAIEITNNITAEENTLFRNIISFGNKEVKYVMTPRMEIFYLSNKTSYYEVQKFIKQYNFSRIPIVKDSADEIVGILHVKDLLLMPKEPKTLDWLQFVLEPYFVPENKKIGDLLKEFRLQKKHMAIIVDEYGGTSGLATLEDILEEIVGEIDDELDKKEPELYVKIAANVYVFEGKTPLNDFCSILKIQKECLAPYHQQTETLGGLLIEIYQDFPQKSTFISTNFFDFTVLEVQKMRIVSIKVVCKKTV